MKMSAAQILPVNRRKRYIQIRSLVLLSLLSGSRSFVQQPLSNAMHGFVVRKRSDSIATTAAASRVSEVSNGRVPQRTWIQRPLPDSKTESRKKTDRTRRKTKPMPITGYNADAILEYYDIRPLQVGWRLNILGFPLLGTFCRLIEWIWKKRITSDRVPYFICMAGWYMRLLMDRALNIDSDEAVQRNNLGWI